MKASTFFDQLRSNPDLELAIELQDGSSVRRDFHITELKNTSISSVDCGGTKNEWKELVIQLWEPAAIGGDVLTTSKALGIIDKVERSLVLLKNVEVKFEYSKPGEVLGVYSVGAITITQDRLLILLNYDQGQCKGLSSGACQPKQRVAMADLSEKSGNSCAPGSGCC